MPEAIDGTDQSTHMSAHMSARTQRIEVITRGERRRRWSAAEKQAIVAESKAAIDGAQGPGCAGFAGGLFTGSHAADFIGCCGCCTST